MKRLGLILVVGAMAFLLAPFSTFAQPRQGMMWRGSGGWGPASPV